jgi:hypothetical protein
MNQVIEKFRNEGSHWQNLGPNFRGPNVLFLALIFFLNFPIADWLTRNVTEGVLPFSPEMVGLANCTYVMAYMLYFVACPEFIRRYPCYRTYDERGHSPRWLVWEVSRACLALPYRSIDKLLGRLIDKKYAVRSIGEDQPFLRPKVTAEGTMWSFSREGAAFDISINEMLPKERERDLFWEVFARYGESRPLWRYLAWGFLTLARISIAFSAMQVIFFVIGQFFREAL